ncbi:MAG: 2Fe-2S iron-sulfur cluster binding domain-containing protein [Finegoldia sp.]|nr:2Fe-2S iron-sulfur cluster binding domain-containing protein [Finegoldia sp.]
MATIIQTTLVIAILSTIFALILTIADKYIADYGEVKLTINDEEYTVEGGNSLLSTLRDQKIFIPSACGGKGSCGYCKVKVKSGGGPVLATEKPHLSEEEMADDVRLSCQVKLREDMKILIPEELFNVREFETKLVEKKELTDKITLFRFELPEGEEIEFKPGQYVQLRAEAYPGTDEYDESDEEVYRAYSIASSKLDKKHIELLIGYTKGIATTYAHKVLKEGDDVMINGPYGDFYYRDEDSEIILGAAGTGFAPIRSILYHMLDNDIKRPARFYFGAKTPDDLFLLDELEMFKEKLYDFEFIPVLSRTTEEMNWKGETGHADDAIRKLVKDGSNKSAYLCGSPRMIESLISALTDVGVPEDKIYYDNFS